MSDHFSNNWRSEWRDLILGDVCTKVGSGATPRGGKKTYLQKGPFALIRSQNVYNDGFHREGLAFISDEQADDLRNVEVLQEDVLLNITGDSVARVCQVDSEILPARVNQHVAIVRPDPAKLDAGFLRYYLVSPHVQAILLSWADSGSTRKALTKQMIESFEVSAPVDVSEQKAIAHVLGVLDDKIELNRRMNETLEEMARALFKSWFVDFEPVRAKMEGRWRRGQSLPGMPAELYDLFPEGMVSSELGEIPDGWEVKALDEIAHFRNGLALQRFRPEDGEDRLPVVKIAQLRSGRPDSGEWARASIAPSCILEDGDIVFSWSGSLLVTIWSGGPAALNQHLFKVTSTEYPKWFYLHCTLSHLDEFRSIAADKATTMGHIKRHHLSDAKCVVPNEKLLSTIDSAFEEILSRRISMLVESCTVSDLRDALLPMLISGKLQSNATEKTPT